jgi:hypothetical protein
MDVTALRSERASRADERDQNGQKHEDGRPARHGAENTARSHGLLELQHTRQGDYLQRMLYYASRAVTGSQRGRSQRGLCSQRSQRGANGEPTGSQRGANGAGVI